MNFLLLCEPLSTTSTLCFFSNKEFWFLRDVCLLLLVCLRKRFVVVVVVLLAYLETHN
jgi:hypothetical protein